MSVLDSLEDWIANHSQVVADLRGDISDLKVNIHDLATDNKALTDRLDEAGTKIDNLESLVAALKSAQG